jgi:predicted NBD/HSP70 family sugar kinase
MRERHRQAVLAAIRGAAAVTQDGIAAGTGLSKSTVSRILGELQRAGIVEVAGSRQAPRGRRPAVVRFKPEGRLAVGIELDDRGCTAGVTDLAARLRRRVLTQPDYGSPESLVQSVVQAFALATEGLEAQRFGAVGVAATGMGTRAGMRQLAAGFGGGLPDAILAARLEERLGLPVVVTDRSKAAAMGEYLHGAGRHSRHLVYVRIGTGIAAGLILDGVLLMGATGSAGELGHIVVEPDGPPCECGGHGCLQAVAGGAALARRARQLLRGGESSAIVRLVGGALDLIDAKVIVAAAAGGDGLALRLLDEMGGLLGRALASCVNLVNPDTVVLGGEVGELVAPYVVDALALRRRALSVPAGAVRVVPGSLGKDAAVIGAAALALGQAPVMPPRAPRP